MDPTLLILLAVLVLSIVAGPALGFWLARRRMRVRDARRASWTEPADPVTSGPLDSLAYAAAQAPAPDPAGAAPSDAGIPPPPRRYASEPPAFGRIAVPPAPATEPSLRDRAPEEPDPLPAPATAPAEDLVPPAPASSSESPSADPVRPTFTSMAELMGEPPERRLNWVERISTGRLLALHRLGYDDPVKIANLRPSEVTRLARALEVPEDMITNDWMPAARRELGIRNPTT